jgi:hypothetical protein
MNRFDRDNVLTAANVGGRKNMVSRAIAFIADVSRFEAAAICWAVWL